MARSVAGVLPAHGLRGRYPHPGLGFSRFCEIVIEAASRAIPNWLEAAIAKATGLLLIPGLFLHPVLTVIIHTLKARQLLLVQFRPTQSSFVRRYKPLVIL